MTTKNPNRPLIVHLSMHRGRRTACGLELRHSDVLRTEDERVVNCRGCKRSVYFQSMQRGTQ